MEIWKSVNVNQGEYIGVYSVSSLGRIRNDKTNRVLKTCINSRGYILAVLSKNGVYKSFSVHRVAGEAFIVNPENKSQINHINRDRTDNRVENLEWVTASENIKHSYADGRSKSELFASRISLGKNPKAKKVINMVTGDVYECAAEAANILNITNRSFCKRLSGELRNNTHFAYLK